MTGGPNGGKRAPVQRVPLRKIARAVVVRHRTPLALVTALLLAAAGGISLLVNGILIPITPPVVNSQQVLLVRVVIFSVPALIAVLAGAPLLAGEYETGTFRFTQTQGAGRRRLLLGTLLVYLLTLTVGAVIVALTISRFYRVLNDHQAFIPWRATTFFSQPLMFVLLTVATFSLGVIMGALLKRNVASITAIVAALAAAVAIVIFKGYHWTLSWLSTTAETNDPGFLHLATYRLFGATSAGELFNRSYLVRDWMENGRGHVVTRPMSPSQFELLHIKSHYTYWAQFVTIAKYHDAQMMWIVIVFAIMLAALVGVFVRVGGRDRLFATVARESRRSPLKGRSRKKSGTTVGAGRP